MDNGQRDDARTPGAPTDTAPGSPSDASERFWEEHYAAHPYLSSGRPNPVLESLAAPLVPGRALDLGCGEGGDTVWLAGRGWRVTAVDVSATALARVAERAEAAGVAERIDPQRHDVARSLPPGPFDLVSAQYFQSPVDFPRPRVLRTAAAAVAPGGMLLVVDHGSVAPWSWHRGQDVHFPTADELLATFGLNEGAWSRERVASPERTATGPNGETATVVDTVVALRRREGGAAA